MCEFITRTADGSGPYLLKHTKHDIQCVIIMIKTHFREAQAAV